MYQIKFKKAQVALEYLLLIGLILALLLPFFYYSFVPITQNTQMSKSTILVNSVTETADVLYSLGPGSQDVILIDMPGGVENVTIQNKEIILKVRIFSGVSDIIGESKADLNGTLNIKSGSWHVLIKNENNTIQISNKY